MYITKKIETETGHRLINYEGKCAHLHGHRYQWEVTVMAADLDETGFVIDYGDLKDILNMTIDELDHAFIFSDQDPLITCSPVTAQRRFQATNGDKGRIHIVPFNPTTENLLPWVGSMVADMLDQVFPGKRVELYKITVYETSGSFAEWYNSLD